MNLREMKEQAAFEAGITDTETLDAYLTSVIKQTLDEYTAQVRYDELYVPDTELTLTAGVGDIVLPDDVQRVDLENIYFHPDGDASGAFRLHARTAPLGSNDGRARYVIRRGESVPTLRVWPYAEITGDDTIVLNYWRKGSALLESDLSVIEPSQLTMTVMNDAIARLAIQTDSKKVAVFRALGRESHGRSFGATNL